MIRVRPADERGITDWGWLDSRHTFSFGEYHDPAHVHFRTLRVINDDHIAPGRGFPTHPHRDMEIISIALAGALRHRDSMGNGSIICPGEVQRMTAGTGITHSEANPSDSEPTHLLQIWILPETRNLPPSYDQKAFADELRCNRLCLVASRGGREGSVLIHQDADLYLTRLDATRTVRHTFAPGRSAWVHVATGAVTLNSTVLRAGDGAAVEGETTLDITATKDAQVLVFDLI